VSIWGKRVDNWVNEHRPVTHSGGPKDQARMKPSGYIGWGVLVWAVGGALYLGGGAARPLGVLVALGGIVMVVVGIIGAGVGAETKNQLQNVPSAGTTSTADELAKLAQLRETGALSPEEFEAQKRWLLTQHQ
jgi:hypothetical protein